MNKYIFTFEGFRQHRLRMRNRRKRKEEILKSPPPESMAGKPMNPDLSYVTTELNL